MGYFSWCCAISKKSIPVNYPKPIHLILPDNTVLSGHYDGYGRIHNNTGDEINIMDAVFSQIKDKYGLRGGAFDNRGVRCAKTDKVFNYGLHFKGYDQTLKGYNKSVNDLLASGEFVELKSNYDYVMEHIKIIADPYYKSPPANSALFITGKKKSKKFNYDKLSVSKVCPYQGFFYPENLLKAKK